MIIIFIHNLKNIKSWEVIVRYLVEIFQLMHLAISAKLLMLKTTRQKQQETVLKNFIGSRNRKSLKNIAL